MRVTAGDVGERFEDSERGGGVANAKPWAGRRFAEDAAVYILKHPDDLGLLTGPRLDVDIERLRSVLAVLACNHDATMGLPAQRLAWLRVRARHGGKVIETRGRGRCVGHGDVTSTAPIRARTPDRHEGGRIESQRGDDHCQGRHSVALSARRHRCSGRDVSGRIVHALARHSHPRGSRRDSTTW